jgi:16S rRNA C1402 (ribose-2'-O) methylase RsmI
MFESCYFGTPTELAAQLKTDAAMCKGEFVVLIRKIKK